MPRFSTLPVVAVVAINLAAQAPAALPPPPSILGFALNGFATIGSQYIWRGLTQTDGRPTVQGELDLVHPSGFYLSTSLSNISWYTDQNAGVASNPTSLGSPGRVGLPLYDPNKVNSAGVELDLFGGYKWSFAKDWTLDIGLYRYLYPGTFENTGAYRNPSTTEAYLGLSYAWASLKYARSTSANYMGVAHSGGTTYADLSLAIPVGESGWTVQLHGGRTTFASNANADYFFNGSRLTGDNALFSYTDSKLGISREVKGYTLALAVTHANTPSRAADHDITVYENAMGRNIGKSRLTFTVTRGF
jgi:uncharacterized protein (TIGR02001 family)